MCAPPTWHRARQPRRVQLRLYRKCGDKCTERSNLVRQESRARFGNSLAHASTVCCASGSWIHFGPRGPRMLWGAVWRMVNQHD